MSLITINTSVLEGGTSQKKEKKRKKKVKINLYSKKKKMVTNKKLEILNTTIPAKKNHLNKKRHNSNTLYFF